MNDEEGPCRYELLEEFERLGRAVLFLEWRFCAYLFLTWRFALDAAVVDDCATISDLQFTVDVFFRYPSLCPVTLQVQFLLLHYSRVGLYCAN